jgi:eukaryotic-like serine/threonine-protein kinase
VQEAGIKEGSLLVGKYRVERVLGQGGMGIVLAARHEQLDERVAIKLMLPTMAAHGEAVTRFVREARAAAKIKGDHVARVSDVGTLETGEPYMVMEYLEGADLSKVLAHSGRLALEDAVDYLLQACDALAQAHALGIVHRDLKPANLYLTRHHDGSPLIKVLDFGVSKIASSALAPNDSSMTRTSALMGSPLYMSPEQMNSARDVDARSDIWALGVILYELLSGEPPFNGTSLPQVCALILQGPTPDIRTSVPQLPEGVVAALYRCLERDPARRFASVAELFTALAPFAPTRPWIRAQLENTNPQAAWTPPPNVASGTQATWGETAPPRPASGFKLGAVIAGLVFLLAAGVGATALYLKHRPTTDPAGVVSALPIVPPFVAAAIVPPAATSTTPVATTLPSATATASSARRIAAVVPRSVKSVAPPVRSSPAPVTVTTPTPRHEPRPPSTLGGRL